MNEVRYLPFSLTDSRYFNLHSTKSGIDKNKLIQNGFEYSFPYITRTDKNNGCDMLLVNKINRLMMAIQLQLV